MDSTAVAEIVVALGLGALGAAAAHVLGVPAPFITGPAVVVTIAGIAGVRASVPDALRDAVFAVTGAVMGSGVTPQVVEAARQWPLSFAGLLLALFVILYVSRWALAALFGFDSRTAVLSASPGHLSFVLGLGSELGGDVPSISVVQSIRILSLTLLVPVIVTLGGFSLDAAVAPSRDMAAWELAAIAVLSFVLGWCLRHARLPAAYLIGGMAVSAAGHATGMVEGAVSQWLAVPAFTIVGTLIGTRFCGITLAALRRAALAGIATTLISVAVSVAAALAIALATGLPLALLLISFAPGGVETMAAMALLMHADPAFVAAHHVFRLFALTALVPLFLGGKTGRSA